MSFVLLYCVFFSISFFLLSARCVTCGLQILILFSFLHFHLTEVYLISFEHDTNKALCCIATHFISGSGVQPKVRARELENQVISKVKIHTFRCKVNWKVEKWNGNVVAQLYTEWIFMICFPSPQNDSNFNECVGVFVATFSINYFIKVYWEESSVLRACTPIQEVCAHML